MKKKALLPVVAILFVFGLSACLKNNSSPKCTSYTLEQDRHVIDSFISNTGQNYISWQSGGFYAGVLNQGSGSKAGSDSIVSYKLIKRLLSGTQIDSLTIPVAGQPQSYTMNSFVNFPVEYYMLSTLNEGGAMRVIIPSSMAFGCAGGVNSQTGQVVVPPNSPLIYDYTLLDVKSQ